MLPDARSDDPLLNDAFDFSRYPIFKTKATKPPTTPDELRRRVRARTLFTYCSHGFPSRTETPRRRSRNVSEPQLMSSTNCMRESWFTDVLSSYTVGDIANLPDADDIFSDARPTQSITVRDIHHTCSQSGTDNDGIQIVPRVLHDSRGVLGTVEPSDHKTEEDSLYSMDSAEQDSHPLLLSMPIIPQIKLERKATVRKPDPTPLSDTAQSQFFLSPRIRDLRTPARLSSRRYGRILVRSSPQGIISDVPWTKSDDYGALSLKGSRRFGPTSWLDHSKKAVIGLVYTRSASEPMLLSSYTSDDEKESLLKKGLDGSSLLGKLPSTIEEVRPSLVPHNDKPVGSPEGPRNSKRVPPEQPKRSHKRSSLNHSLSFNSIIHAVADGYASIDLFLRKPKTKSSSTTKHELYARVPNARDPTFRWAPKDGQIVIKVFVPSTDDIWALRTPQDISLADFTSRVVTKLGFIVSFSGSLWDEPRYYFTTDEQFRSWLKGRIRFGRNLPIVAHVIPPLSLARLNAGEHGRK